MLTDYHTSNSKIARQEIYNGTGAGDKYVLKLKASNKSKIGAHTTEYWMSKGLSYQEAVDRIKLNTYNRTKAATAATAQIRLTDPVRFHKKYENVEYKNRTSYWTDRGYTIEEASSIVLKIQRPYLNTIEGFVERYGEIEGKIRYNNVKMKRNQTMIDRYGATFISNRTSKASLKYFIPVYKILRKMGIDKHDIVWGIANNKEFTTTDLVSKKTFAFDFVIKSKKLILEYNDIFWHARENIVWTNPFLDYNSNIEHNNQKRAFIEGRGYKVFYIWSDNLIPPKKLVDQIL